MQVFDNIKDYFVNSSEAVDDYSNSFYIRSIEVDNTKDHKIDEIYLKPHKRSFFEIAILYRTSVSIQIGNQTLQNKKNTLAIVSPFQTINYKRKGKKNNDIGYIINFKASLFENLNNSYDVQNEFPFFKLHSLPMYQLNDEDFKGIELLAKEIFEESRAGKLNNLNIITHLLLVLLYKIKRITHNNEGITSMNRNDIILAKFEQKILSNNTTFLSVKEYASMMNISAIYLSECVKKATGKSAQKIIIDYKILYSKTLLNQKDKTITEIAEILGFNEAANFNQFFKRNTGMTATQFRKSV
ncbi:helix-turn-helix domain-containing protein [Lutibacter sp. A80]|uniref:helix-turn-helix domain-containing protein n=1 Tax=Lutibacter sp. A80 TaxID=2918453 RepID=UPI001F06B646|nr:helix-turn-helix domain-containing protein [Lutibacter sp. A80]UMB61025.1 helix-turn-helix domain-containing protein [Lutibacter sp. A80]